MNRLTPEERCQNYQKVFPAGWTKLCQCTGKKNLELLVALVLCVRQTTDLGV